MTLDALNIAKRLRNTGFTHKSSEELAEILKDSQQELLDEVATKNDIVLLRRDLKSEISLVRKDMNIVMYKSVITMGVIMTLVEKFIN